MIMNKLKKNYVSILNKYTAQIILAALLIFFGAAVGFGKFFSSANLISIVRQITTMGIAALGISFLMITANLDFSVGAIYAFAGTFTANCTRLSV